MSNGIEVTQQGVGIDKASDYQKVLDSRWLFMEVGLEIDTTFSVPAMGAQTTFGYQRVNIMRHGMTRKGVAFVPAFHASYKITETYNEYLQVIEVAADDTWIYFYRTYSNGSTPAAWTVQFKAKVYTLPILEAYLAPVEIAPLSGRTKSSIGVRALDGTDSSVDINESSSHGFSIDTRKKILSIHKVVQKKINYAFYDSARVTAVDTTTDILTLTIDPNQSVPDGGSSTGIGWIQTGQQIQYNPGDFTTYPSPLSSGVLPYIIKVDDTHIKLALSAADAQAGTAINLTTAGSIPSMIRRNPLADDWRIPHDNDYPPSYLFCDIVANPSGVGRAFSGFGVNSLKHFSTTPLVMADNRYLYFRGVQAVYISNIALIILKDPIEVAQ
jgi:hypothetical protein